MQRVKYSYGHRGMGAPSWVGRKPTPWHLDKVKNIKGGRKVLGRAGFCTRPVPPGAESSLQGLLRSLAGAPPGWPERVSLGGGDLLTTDLLILESSLQQVKMALLGGRVGWRGEGGELRDRQSPTDRPPFMAFLSLYFPSHKELLWASLEVDDPAPRLSFPKRSPCAKFKGCFRTHHTHTQFCGQRVWGSATETEPKGIQYCASYQNLQCAHMHGDLHDRGVACSIFPNGGTCNFSAETTFNSSRGPSVWVKNAAPGP